MIRWILPCIFVFSTMASSAVADTNVVLITVDALRADHLAPYGYQKGNTPAISALAEEGVTFERAIVQTPLVTSSHATILTGTYPQYHGLQHSLGNLRTDVPTLAEWFRSQDYVTGAFVGSALLLSQWGLNRGFEIYDDHFSMSTSRPTEFDSVQRPAEVVVNHALSWLDQKGEGPFFLWLHFSDPQEPFTPPAPYSGQFTSAPYDGEIAYLDAMLVRFFGVLRDKGLYENSLIVLTAPHGTALGEHSETSHGLFLYHCCLHVPLILRLPRGTIPAANDNADEKLKLVDVRVAEQVRSVDLAPTIVQLLGGQVPDSMQGKSLLAYLTREGAISDLPAYSETHYPSTRFGWSPLFSYTSGRYKLIRAPYPELYDLQTDPAELKNIHDDRKELALELDSELEQLLSRFKSKYNRSSSDPGSADPKMRIEVYRLLAEAVSASRSGLSERAVTAVREVLQKDPGNPAAHFVLGSQYMDQGKDLLAVQEFRAGLRKTPASYEHRVSLSLAYLRTGLNGQAQQMLNELIEENPADSVARQFLAISYAKQGKLEEAITHGKIAVEMRPLSASAHYNLASYYLGSGRDVEAAKSFEKTVEISPTHIQGRTNLSLVLLRLSRYDEAIIQAKEVVKLEPDFSLGHFYLGQAYLAKGMAEEAEAAFLKAKELDPQLKIPVPNR